MDGNEGDAWQYKNVSINGDMTWTKEKMSDPKSDLYTFLVSRVKEVRNLNSRIHY